MDMRSKQVQVGGRYLAKVSGKVVQVDVTGETYRTTASGRTRTVYRAINLRTGRKLELSAARLRMAPETQADRDAARDANRRVMWSMARINGLRAGLTPADATAEAERIIPDGQPERVAETTPASLVIQVRENLDKNGVEITFPVAPPEAVREDLKAYGFRYSRRFACWWARAQRGMVEAVTSLLGAWNERGVIPAVAAGVAS